MFAEDFFIFIYNPTTATVIASVALLVSLYVLHRQNAGMVKKTARRGKGKTAKNFFQQFVLPRAMPIALKDAGILALIVLIGIALFAFNARGAGLDIQKHIGLGIRYVAYTVYMTFEVSPEDTTVAAVAESATVDEEGAPEEINPETLVEEKAETTVIKKEDTPQKEIKKTETKIAESPVLPPPPPPSAPPVVVPVLIPEPVSEPINPETSSPAPDATVSAFSHYGAALEVGGLISFSVVVSNDGKTDMEVPFNTQLVIDEQNDGTINFYFARLATRPLEVGEKETKIWKSAWVAKLGTHRVRVCADEGNVLLEMNEKNNCAELVFTVKGSEVSGDLVIEELLMHPPEPASGYNVSFSARVANKASSAAKRSRAYISVDGILLAKILVPSLGAGVFEKIESGTVWKATPGAHSYKLCADGAGEVFETNEDNNCSIGTFFVPEN